MQVMSCTPVLILPLYAVATLQTMVEGAGLRLPGLDSQLNHSMGLCDMSVDRQLGSIPGDW